MGYRGRVFLLSSVLIITFAGINLPRERTGQPLSTTNLRLFPNQILGWKGEERDIPNPVLKTLGVDEYMMREYIGGNQNFYLYIGYYRDQKGAKKIHSPRHCYPASGWRIIEASTMDFKVTGSNRKEKFIPVNRYLLEKSGEKELVYYWYQTGDTVEANEYFAILSRFRNAVFRNRTDGMLVRLSARIRSGDIKNGEKMAASIPHIFSYLSDNFTM